MIVALICFGIFATMFLGAIIGEVRGNLSFEQTRMLAQQSLFPLFLAVITGVPAYFISLKSTPRAN